MRFDVITLFPEFFAPLTEAGVNRRAYQQKSLDLRLWPLRDYGEGNYRRVDDRPFGGGPGMVLMAEPLAACLRAVRHDRDEAPAQQVPVVLFTPAGKALRQADVAAWAASRGAILVCGRYEGVDQRFVDRHVDVQLSLGDFVLSGGEIAAMALLDAVARTLPGVLHDARSHQQDSFAPALDGLLDSPHYTRPERWQDADVPPVLLSGHHGQIDRWRREQSVLATARRRPDLLAAARAAGKLSAADLALLEQHAEKL